MSYKDNYKSIQINFMKDKHAELIKWLEKLCYDEERSFNSIVIHILKKEFDKCVKNLRSKSPKQ